MAITAPTTTDHNAQLRITSLNKEKTTLSHNSGMHDIFNIVV